MKTQVVIVGGGPGGASAAMFLKQLGIDSVIVEKETFPRFHIGESMTGECGGVVRALSLQDKMMQAQHPIKHGVKVYGTGGKNAWFVPVMMRTPEWELKEQFTWQVRRSEFDKMMLDEAVARGATLLRGQATKPIMGDDGSIRGVHVRMADGGELDIHSELLLDCSGQHTWLANLGLTGPKYLGSYDKQVAIFSQVANPLRDDDTSREKAKDNTLIFYQKKYHWAWWIPIDDEIVSVGVVTPSATFQERKQSKRDFLAAMLHEINPEIQRRIPKVNLVEETRSIVNYSFQVKKFAGKGFLCLGDSRRFIDPIFSFGLYVTMKEAQMAAPIIRDYLNGKDRDVDNPFAEYVLKVEQGADVFEDMIDTFWEHPLAFATFVHARHTPLMIDIFAGRVYERQPSVALNSMRGLLQRERDYSNDDTYSVPVGSRYHPERAPIWEYVDNIS